MRVKRRQRSNLDGLPSKTCLAKQAPPDQSCLLSTAAKPKKTKKQRRKETQVLVSAKSPDLDTPKEGTKRRPLKHKKGKLPQSSGSITKRIHDRDDAGAPKKSSKRFKASCSNAPRSSSPGAFRQEHDIWVSRSSPAPVATFEAAEVLFGARLVRALRRQRYVAPTAIQAQVWSIAMLGDDLVGVAKTGSGKTCAFLLPALARHKEVKAAISQSHSTTQPHALVLAPTRELAQQIASEAAKFAPVAAVRVVCVFGGVAKGAQVGDLERGADLLVATPGRLLDFCRGKSSRGLLPPVSLISVTYLVLDEADRMLDLGFEPDIRKIVQRCPNAGKPGKDGRQTLFFTATWPDAVQRAASSFTRSSGIHVHVGQQCMSKKADGSGNGGERAGPIASDLVSQTVMVVSEEGKLPSLKETIAKKLKPGETAIVFATRKTTCDLVEQELRNATVSSGTHMRDPPLCAWCRALHGDKEQHERDAILGAFRAMTMKPQPGRKAVLVATDVASRGLDIPGVAMVVIFDFGGESDRPGIDSYVHRIGRTGRADKAGRSFAFFTEHDASDAVPLIELLKASHQDVPVELQNMAAAESSWQSATWSSKRRKYTQNRRRLR